MNKHLKDVLLQLLSKNFIGAKHTYEKKILNQNLRAIGKKERKEFQKEYNKCLNDAWFLRIKKRTGKNSDWHVSLNPRKLEDIYEALEGESDE